MQGLIIKLQGLIRFRQEETLIIFHLLYRPTVKPEKVRSSETACEVGLQAETWTFESHGNRWIYQVVDENEKENNFAGLIRIKNNTMETTYGKKSWPRQGTLRDQYTRHHQEYQSSPQPSTACQ